MDRVQIVPVHLQHAFSFRECLDEVARESRMLALLEAPPMDRVMSFLVDNVKNDYPQFFAIDEGEVVGWIDINPFSNPGQSHRGSLGMGIRRSHRGKGLGRKLMEAGIARAKLKGFEKIELDVFSDNRAAIELYRSMGFEDEGLVKRYRKLEGRYQDVISMALFI